MKYFMKSGILYQENEKEQFFKTKCSIPGMDRQIVDSKDTLVMETTIRRPQSLCEKCDVRFSEYLLTDAKGGLIAKAVPSYSEEEDPSVNGWPINRMPRVQSAHLTLLGQSYTLTMENDKVYKITDANGQTVIEILHRGLLGGWDFDVSISLDTPVLCGIFSFCRYLEQENDFVHV